MSKLIDAATFSSGKNSQLDYIDLTDRTFHFTEPLPLQKDHDYVVRVYDDKVEVHERQQCGEWGIICSEGFEVESLQ